MLKVLLVSVLLAIAFSWEDAKRTMRVLAVGLLHKSPGRYYMSRLDQMVGTIILLATIPLGLTSALASEGSIQKKLLIILLELAVFSLFAAGSAGAVRWIRASKKFSTREKYVPAALALASLAAPVIGLFSGTDTHQRTVLARFALLLSIPPAIGLVLSAGVRLDGQAHEYLPNLDALILLLVASLMLRMTIDVLERAFLRYRIRQISAYFRVLLGIALSGAIITGLLK